MTFDLSISRCHQRQTLLNGKRQVLTWILNTHTHKQAHTHTHTHTQTSTHTNTHMRMCIHACSTCAGSPQTHARIHSHYSIQSTENITQKSLSQPQKKSISCIYKLGKNNRNNQKQSPKLYARTQYCPITHPILPHHH